jgi:hypothetical protein
VYGGHHPIAGGRHARAAINPGVPVVSVGLEPAVTVSGGLSFFFGFGLRALFVPNSKSIDENSPEFDPDEGVLPLTENSDKYQRVEFSGLTIGVRLRF